MSPNKWKLTVHCNLITSIGRDLLAAQLGVLEGTGPRAPLSRLCTTVSTGVSYGLCLHLCFYHSRGRIGERNGKSLDQITTACSHAGPQGKTVFLWAWHLGEHKCGVCFTDPWRRRAEGEVRAESDLILGIDKAEDGEDGEVSERHDGCR